MGPAVERSAVLSPDARYHYLLTRRWGPGPRTATIVGLNPSTADAEVDDPTLTRCLAFARRWRCSALRLVNVYAWRSPDPTALWLAADPVGIDNDAHLARAVSHDDGPVVVAWGAAARPERVGQALGVLGETPLHCLGRTTAGAPRHPLYLPATTRRRPFAP